MTDAMYTDAVDETRDLYEQEFITRTEFERRMERFGFDWWEVQEMIADIAAENGQFGMGA